MTPPPDILLADDHAAIRMGLRGLVLQIWPGSRVVEVSDGATLAKELLARSWNLVVVDQTLPGATGLDILAEHGRSVPALVYTMHESPEIVRKARAAGAKGFVSKTSDPAVLEAALREVIAGREAFPPGSGGEDGLSQREREVMALLLAGKGPKEVAFHLDISQSSVQTHTTRLLKKLGLSGTRELFRWAASRGTL